ncbi:MAG: terminase small subunit [Novosphingobium sp.]|nr:terminase small subunit [Novosphingobium sp.]
MGLAIRNDGLTEQQEAFVRAFVEKGDVSAAALVAGYSHASMGFQALKSPRVQSAIRDYRDRILNSEGATVAYLTLLDCMKPDKPGAVRVSAAKIVWQAVGMLDKNEARGEKSLQEMSPDELAEQIKKFDQALAQVADGAKPVPKVIEG